MTSNFLTPLLLRESCGAASGLDIARLRRFSNTRSGEAVGIGINERLQ